MDKKNATAMGKNHNIKIDGINTTEMDIPL